MEKTMSFVENILVVSLDGEPCHQWDYTNAEDQIESDQVWLKEMGYILQGNVPQKR